MIKVKKYLFWSLSFLFILQLLISGGCSKARVESDIIGTWQVVNVDTLSSSKIEEWEFTQEKIFYFKFNKNSYSEKDTGQYTVRNSWGKKYVNITDCNNPNHNREWRVWKVNDKTLKIIYVTKYGLTFKEFIKE